MLLFMSFQQLVKCLFSLLEICLFLMLKNLTTCSWNATAFGIYLSSSTYSKNKSMYDLQAGISTIV
jgi:hypothetical protein